jgi:hypothetical protein
VYDRFENFLKLGEENVYSMKNTAPVTTTAQVRVLKTLTFLASKDVYD